MWRSLVDLELRQEQFGQRDSQWLQGETVAETDLVTHLEGADQDIHLTPVLLVEEQQPLAPVERVEPCLGLVALILKKPLRFGGGPFRRDPIEIRVPALESRVQAILCPDPDRQSPEQS